MNLNATLLVQIAVFAALWWFVAKYVWPPITSALDQRSQRIADGLAAADKAKADLQAAERRVEVELKKARDSANEVRIGAEKQASSLLEEARTEAALAAQRAKDSLKEQVAALAVAGAERILRREIDASRHADLLTNLKNELR